VKVIDDRRNPTYSIVLGVWGMVAVYAMVHDQYIVRIAPEHFTEYHPPLWGIEEAPVLALVYAARSSLAPGLIWGLVLARTARHGTRPKIPVGVVLFGCGAVILLTELTALASGWWVWTTGRYLFPEAVYPDDSLPLRITTTIQGVCYLVGAMLAGLWTAGVARQRGRSLCSPAAGD
jgi:NOL1/NOP2/fmu family ribosome biogenesis protein